jgi:NitT/TauT family transport system ATP-binding protein
VTRARIDYVDAMTTLQGGAPSGDAPPEIDIRNVSMRYRTVSGDAVLALDRVSLAVRPKEFVCVVGTSGCGKTTLLRIIAGLVRHTAGRVSLRERDISGPSSDVGIVFQGPVLLPWKTVLDNVMIPVVVLGLDRAAHRRRAVELLDLVGLAGFEDKYPKELSGGMQQRASIARALVHRPSLLLMDEPFGALDAMTRETMNLELQRIAKDAAITVLFITHSIQEAVFLGDRVVVMTPRPGRVAETFTIDLPRPRELDLMSTPEFGAYVRAVRQLLNARGMIH